MDATIKQKLLERKFNFSPLYFQIRITLSMEAQKYNIHYEHSKFFQWLSIWSLVCDHTVGSVLLFCHVSAFGQLAVLLWRIPRLGFSKLAAASLTLHQRGRVGIIWYLLDNDCGYWIIFLLGFHIWVISYHYWVAR